MIRRNLASSLKHYAAKFPVIALTGPRQSGKTTLVRHTFPHCAYISLENLDIRDHAVRDPRDFLETYRDGVIIDEFHHAPNLLSYIQTIVDEKHNKSGLFILTGSQNFLMLEKISQTLAGRIALLTLLPLSISELQNTQYNNPSYEGYIINGLYPRLYDKDLKPHELFPNYIKTYIERDVRLIKNIPHLTTFQTFLKMCAGRNGQILNLSSLGNDCGISHNTAKAWLSILEASYIVFLLKPHYNNYNKRLVKMPKLYFYDTGIACSLMGLHTAEQVSNSYAKGALFESLIIAELIKHQSNKGFDHTCYYWRDKRGIEIDCIIEQDQALIPIEIKAGKTAAPDFFKELTYWNSLAKNDPKKSYVIYGGNATQHRTVGTLLDWRHSSSVFRD